jgi:hypothetical protein
MDTYEEIEKLDARIQEIKRAALALSEIGESFPVVVRNSARILASVKMLEINFSDLLSLSADTDGCKSEANPASPA